MSLIDTIYNQIRDTWGNSRAPSASEVLAAVYDPGTRTLKATGGGGGVNVGTLANRPNASSVSSGYTYFATDDNGGSGWVSDGSTWLPLAPPADAVGGRLLAVAEPLAANTYTPSEAGEMVRMTELTISFVMPSTRVLIQTSQARIQQLLTATDPLIALQYTTDGWATAKVIQAKTPATDKGASPFYINVFSGLNVLLPSNIPADSNVQVALFVGDADATPDLSVAISPSDTDINTYSRPFISATALGV